MIFDSISNVDSYLGISAKLDKAFSYLKTQDLSLLEEGPHAIDGDDVFVLISQPTTRTLDESFFEIHKEYIDIHVDIVGSEDIGICDVQQATPCGSMSNDFQKVTCDIQQQIHLTPGHFLVCFPQDAHRPLMCVGAPATIKKACFKIRNH